MGFLWDKRGFREQAEWNANCASLAAFRLAHGHCDPSRLQPDQRQLAHWCWRQRVRRIAGKLSAEAIRRLDELGFEWEINKHRLRWRSRREELAAFQRRFGHCRVSTLSKEYASLGNWVRAQRSYRRRGLLTAEQIALLDELKFDWGIEKIKSRTSWETRFRAMVAFCREHGHCSPSASIESQAELARWATAQRRHKRLGALCPEKVRRLDELGFSWKAPRSHGPTQGDRVWTFQARWDHWCQALADYRQRHGHCNVPPRDDARLCCWGYVQRTAMRKGKLDAERVRRLESLGFEWDAKEARWEGMFAALQDYKKEHGNCGVPSRWAANPKLASWVNTQRQMAATGKLRADRRKRLEELQITFRSASPAVQASRRSPAGAGRRRTSIHRKQP
jgi:hypothetical protein